MSPRAFENARKNTNLVNDIAIIDGAPYAPLAAVNPEEHKSVKQVAALLLNHSTNFPLKRTSDKLEEYLKVDKIPFGITNSLFLVSGWSTIGDGVNTEDTPDPVLIRIFGAEGMIDRDIETSTYAALARSGIAPKYYGRFANGRMEQFLAGYRHLEVKELSDTSLVPGIATAVAAMHSYFQVPEDLQEYHPLEKPSMWSQLQDWYAQARTAKFRTSRDSDMADALQLPLIQNELDWLKIQLPANPVVVFCHNDLLAANILFRKDQPIQLIDFEYGGVNYRSFDIANHFCEFAGGPPHDAEPDYSLMPSHDVQEQFIKSYLEATPNAKCDEAAVKELFHEVQGFVLASHLYWGLWAVNQASTEGCSEYDFILYSRNRIKQYWISKEEWSCA